MLARKASNGFGLNIGCARAEPAPIGKRMRGAGTDRGVPGDALQHGQ